jgi:uncharacterized protein
LNNHKGWLIHRNGDDAMAVIDIRRWGALSARFIMIFCGFYIIAHGTAFTINANIGVMPWTVFHIGIAKQTGLTIGRVSQIVGLVAVIVGLLWKIKFNIGTILDVFFVGYFLDRILDYGYVPIPNSWIQQVTLYVFGVLLVGFGIALYMSADLGVGPRDGLMLALAKATGFKIGTVRTLMEVIITVAGYFLGGPLGVGTVVFALLIGQFMSAGFFLVKAAQKAVLLKM